VPVAASARALSCWRGDSVWVGLGAAVVVVAVGSAPEELLPVHPDNVSAPASAHAVAASAAPSRDTLEVKHDRHFP
jgi:hypothetical protein